ncbi:MAG: Holliday junction resolvase [Thermoplasmata archaeon]|nr:MAG: Holliday junction resolvase [Thermoplasmata archaeon]
MTGSNYERELRSILRGDEEILEIVTRSCSEDEKRKYSKILKRPFITIRAAGSLGIDLVAVRDDISMLIEIKSSVSDRIHFSSMKGKLQRQAEHIKEECEKAKVLPIYAFRLKNRRGDAWRLFTLDVDGLEGKAKEIHDRLPKLKLTKDQNLVMKWNEGLPLSEFIDMITK